MSFPQLEFDAASNKFKPVFQVPGQAAPDPAAAFAQSAIGDAIRPGPDRRLFYHLLGVLGQNLLDANANQGGISALNPAAALSAINPLAAQQLIKPGPIPKAITPLLLRGR